MDVELSTQCTDGTASQGTSVRDHKLLEQRVREARAGPTVYYDPDMLVGPVAGRFVGKPTVQQLIHRIGTVLGFDDLFAVLIVIEDGLGYVVGGSHRLQAVVGCVPVSRIPTKVIDVSGIVLEDGNFVSMKTHGACVVSAVQATESHAKVYEVIEDVIVLMDILDLFFKHYDRQTKLMEKKGISVKGYKRDAGGALQYYKQYWQNSVQVIDSCLGDDRRRRVMRGAIELHKAGRETVMKMFHHCMDKQMCLTAAQISNLATWTPSDINNKMKTIDSEVQLRRHGHESSAYQGWKPFTGKGSGNKRDKSKKATPGESTRKGTKRNAAKLAEKAIQSTILEEKVSKRARRDSNRHGMEESMVAEKGTTGTLGNASSEKGGTAMEIVEDGRGESNGKRSKRLTEGRKNGGNASTKLPQGETKSCSMYSNTQLNTPEKKESSNVEETSVPQRCSHATAKPAHGNVEKRNTIVVGPSTSKDTRLIITVPLPPVAQETTSAEHPSVEQDLCEDSGTGESRRNRKKKECNATDIVETEKVCERTIDDGNKANPYVILENAVIRNRHEQVNNANDENGNDCEVDKSSKGSSDHGKGIKSDDGKNNDDSSVVQPELENLRIGNCGNEKNKISPTGPDSSEVVINPNTDTTNLEKQARTSERPETVEGRVATASPQPEQQELGIETNDSYRTISVHVEPTPADCEENTGAGSEDGTVQVAGSLGTPHKTEKGELGGNATERNKDSALGKCLKLDSEPNVSGPPLQP